MFDRNRVVAGERTDVCEPQALRTKSGDNCGQWRTLEGRAAGEQAMGTVPRPGQARAQQKPQTGRRTWLRSPRPLFPDGTYTFPPNGVSLVLLLLLFGKKRSGYGVQQCSDGSTPYRKLHGSCDTWPQTSGKRPLSEDHTALFSAFCAEMLGLSCTPSGDCASPAVAPSPNVSLCPLLTAGTVFAEALCSAILICPCK